MFDGTVFVIIVSWSSAAHDSMIRVIRSLHDAESILLNFDYFEYAIYFFIRVDDQRKNQITKI